MLSILASRGLFMGLIAMVAVVVALCIGFAVLMILKPIKIKKTIEADAVKKELYRRETELVVKIITEKAEGEKREELINSLRRVRSAETIVEEIIRNEKTERGIAEKPSGGAKRPAGVSAAQRKPVATSAAEDKKAESSAKFARAEKPSDKKKKDSKEFEPTVE